MPTTTTRLPPARCHSHTWCPRLPLSRATHHHCSAPPHALGWDQWRQQQQKAPHFREAEASPTLQVLGQDRKVSFQRNPCKLHCMENLGKERTSLCMGSDSLSHKALHRVCVCWEPLSPVANFSSHSPETPTTAESLQTPQGSEGEGPCQPPCSCLHDSAAPSSSLAPDH